MGKERAFIKDDLVTKYFDFYCAAGPFDETCEDLTHRFRAGFDVHGANAEDDGWTGVIMYWKHI